MQKSRRVLWTQDGQRDRRHVFRGQTSPLLAAFGKTSGSTSKRYERSSRLVSATGARASICDGIEVHQCQLHGRRAYTRVEVPLTRIVYRTHEETSFNGRRLVISAGHWRFYSACLYLTVLWSRMWTVYCKGRLM